MTNALQHKFDKSHICVACGHSQGWTEKWQVFACVPELKACPYCQQPIEASVARKIIAFDPVRRKKYVSERVMEFCSAECGLHYQMGAEG